MDRNARRRRAIAEARGRGLYIATPRGLMKLNAAVKERDGGLCRVRIAGVCTGVAEQVHHTLGRYVSGDVPEYMVASCRACNLRIGEPMKGIGKPVEPEAWMFQ